MPQASTAAAAQQVPRSSLAQTVPARQGLPARPPRRYRAVQRVCAALNSGNQPGETRREFLKLGSGAVLSTLLFERAAWAEARSSNSGSVSEVMKLVSADTSRKNVFVCASARAGHCRQELPQ